MMNLIVKRERCHAKIHGAPVVEIDLKKSTIARERESSKLRDTTCIINRFESYYIYSIFWANKNDIKYDWHCHTSIAQCAAHGLVFSLLVAKTRVEKLSVMKAAVLLCGRCRLRSKSQMLFGRHPCRCSSHNRYVVMYDDV